MVKHFKEIMAISALLFILLLIMPASIAHENQTDASQILADSSSDIYFDASAIDDGDGSKEKPYKTMDSSRLRNDSNIYIEEGEYILQSDEFNLSNVNIYGKSPQKTVIYAFDSNTDVLNINTNGKISITNVTLNSLRFTVNDELEAKDTNFILHLWYKHEKGGAIYSPAESFSKITIDNCNFHNYTACSGGAILCDNGVLNIYDSGFYSNYVIPYEYVLAEGGAILIHNSTANIRGSHFKSNSADYSAGAICSVYSNTTLYDCTFEDNEAQLGVVQNVEGNLNVANSTFKNNRVSYGAIFSSIGNVTVTDSTFEDNSAKYSGGAICVEKTSLTVSSSHFKNNSAVTSGGSVYADFSSDVDLSDNDFNSDSSNRLGGSVFVQGSRLSLKDNTISDSKALFGAGIAAISSNITSNGDVIKNCRADYYGGAIFEYFGSLSLKNTDLEKNSAELGGALYLRYASLDIDGADISENAAVNGTAGYLFMVNHTDFRNLELKNNEFTESSDFDYFYGSGNYTMMKTDDTFNGNLPSKYNSADYGYITPVSDQMNGDYCWAFSTMAVLESCIAKATGLQYDLSENNLINHNRKYSSYGLNKTVQGGNAINAIGYLLSWLGPVGESNDTYDPVSMVSPVLESLMHVQNVLFLNMKYDGSDNDAIKEAIMRYGAVGTSIYWMQLYPLQNGSSYYHYSDEPALANHAITLVGWDDNYSKDNFGLTPPGDGAWICKNTWGTGTGDHGYFYISYYCNSLNYEFYKVSDEYMNLDWVFTFILNDTLRLDKNYQYDYAGPTTSWTFDNGDSVKNVFRATDDEYLAAVSTYFLQDTEYQIDIYVNGELVHSQSSTAHPGYYTIDLERIIPLKANDTFEVAFTMYDMDDSYFEVYCSNRGEVTADVFGEGISYVSYQGDDGWYDVGSYTIFCIKAFTIADELKTTLALAADYNSRNPVNITAIVLDEYGRKVTYGNVTFTLEGHEFTVNVTDGEAKLTHNFKKGESTITAAFNGLGYTPSLGSIGVDVYKEEMKVDLAVSTYLNTASINITTPERFSSLLEVTVNNKTKMMILMNGKAQLDLDDLANGDNVVTVSLYDCQDYDGQTTQTFVIDVIQPKIISADFTTYENSKEAYQVKLVDDKSSPVSGKTVKFNINGRDFEAVTDNGGIAALPIDLACGEYQITSDFTGDGVYLPAGSANKIRVKEVLEADVNVIKNYRDANVDIALSKNISIDLKVDVDHITSTVSAVNGKANLKIDGLKNGNHTIEVYLESDRYHFVPVEKDFNIDVVETRIISEDMDTIDDYGENYSVKLVDIDVEPISGKTVNFNINGRDFEAVTDSKGIATLPLDLAGGNYKITASFAGDGTYMPSNASNDIKIRTNLAADIVVAKELRTAEISIKLSKDVDVDMVLSINGKNQTINSKQTLKLTDMANGDYNLCLYLDDPVYIFKSNPSRFTVNIVETKLVAKNITAKLASSEKYAVRLIDVNNEGISAKTVNINFNGKSSKAVTDDDGFVSISLNTLAPGSYKIEVRFDGIGNYLASSITNTITITSTVVLPTSDVYTYNSEYMVKLYDEHGKAIKNSAVAFDINGVVKSVNSINGIATLAIDLAPGNYDVKVTNPVTGEVNSQSITVKPRLSENKAITMYYGGGKTYKVKVLDDNGNVASGVKVTIKIGTTTKTVTTDSNGYASYKIAKKPGKYTITATYNGFKVSNKVTVKTTIVTKNMAVKKGKTFKFTAKLLNKNGKILKNKQITFKFNGKTQKIKTNNKGIATLKVTKKLKVGKYTVKTTYGKLTVSNKITIKK